MEPDLPYKPNYRIADIPLVDMPLGADIDSASMKKICGLLDEGNRIVRISDRTDGGDYSILTHLRGSLPGFVAVLDHREVRDLSAALAKSLSLGTDQTDENILHSRWKAFSEVTKHSNLPLTLIVPDADSLSQSRLTQILEFLDPINGRLILVGSDDVSKSFAAAAVVPEATESDKGVPPSPGRDMLSGSTHNPQVTVPISDISDLLESPIFTDESPHPQSASAAEPERVPPLAAPAPKRAQKETHQPLAPRPSKSRPKTRSWLIAGLALSGVLGLVVVTLPTPYGPVDFERWFKGITDGSLLKNMTQLVQRRESPIATEPEETSGISHSDLLQQIDEDAMDKPSADMTDIADMEDMADVPQALQPISPETVAADDMPAAPVAADSVMDIPALEKAPTIQRDPEVEAATDMEPGAAPAAVDTSTASQPAAPPADEPVWMQAPEPEITPDPQVNARMASIYLRRAERELEIGNLQQSLLEVVRGLDVDPDNERLQDLRREVLDAMDARMR